MAQGYRMVAGVDEAGRGPWAGPVVAAAVVFQGRRIPRGLDDSKKLTAMAREVAYGKIMTRALVGIGIADVATIDRINILQATLQAMRDAIRALPCLPDLALVDGNRAPELDCAVRTMVEGDALSVSVAAASIIAKVTRDRIMCALEETCPGYDFRQNKGYGTPEHRAALERLGVSPHHRLSFAPVAERAARGDQLVLALADKPIPWFAIDDGLPHRSSDDTPLRDAAMARSGQSTT